MSTAYHPQTDGQTEQVNQLLEQYLQVFTECQPNDWSSLMATAGFAYNNVAHKSTGLSLFFVEYGYHPKMAPDVQEELGFSTLEDIFQNCTEAKEQAQAPLALATEQMKWYYNKHKSEVPFKVGNKVLLKSKDLKIK